jgi:hypothetical protein
VIVGPQGPTGPTGKTGPTGALGATGATIYASITNGAPYRILTATGATGVAYSNSKLTFDGNILTVSGSVYASGDITALSDERFNKDITTIEDPLSIIKQLRGVYYTTQDSLRRTGVIAQEIEQVLPEVVVTNESGKSVAYGNIVGLLIEGIKVLSNRCDELEKKLVTQATGDGANNH